MSENEKPKAVVSKAGPIKLSGITAVKIKPSGETIEVPRGKILLCGCGNSSKMPRCDGSHADIGFESQKHPERVPNKDKDYWGNGITVHFDLGVCAHVAYCLKGLRSVFDTHKRPWIDPTKGDNDEIIKVVRSCPAGALSYTLEGEDRVDSFDSEVEVIYDEGGPFEMWGGIELEGAEAPKVADHYTLCSCGKSKNHPYCDGEHNKLKKKA